MSHRAHFALIAEDKVFFHSDKWGGWSVAGALALGPAKLRMYLELCERAKEELKLIPEDYIIVDFDRKTVGFSEEAGLAHLRENAITLFPDLPDLARNVSDVTPSALNAFFKVIDELWQGWTVAAVHPCFSGSDWEPLLELRGSKVAEAFKPVARPHVQSSQKDWLVPEMRQILQHTAQGFAVYKT